MASPPWARNPEEANGLKETKLTRCRGFSYTLANLFIHYLRTDLTQQVLEHCSGNVIMKTVRLLCYYVFVSFFGPDRVKRSIAFLSF